MVSKNTKNVGLVAAALGAFAGGFWTSHATRTEAAPAAPVELTELRASIDRLNTRLDDFNRRLSWLEGATSGALKPPSKEER